MGAISNTSFKSIHCPHCKRPFMEMLYFGDNIVLDPVLSQILVCPNCKDAFYIKYNKTQYCVNKDIP